MLKRPLLLASVLLAVFVIAGVVVSRPDVLPEKGFSSPQEGTYEIEKTPVTLVAGISEVSISGGSSRVTTRYFGNSIEEDINGDGKSDTVFFLTQESSGSGIFFYVAVALKQFIGYRGTNAVFIGDRVLPKTIEVKDGVVRIDYAERLPGESLTEEPTLVFSKFLKLDGDRLAEIKPPAL